MKAVRARMARSRPITDDSGGGASSIPPEEFSTRRCTDGAHTVAGWNTEGAVHARERESPRLGAQRAALRELARLPRDPRPTLGLSLRGGRERVARLDRVEEQGSRGDVDAVERGDRLRRRRPAEGLEGVDACRGRREGARRSGGARDLSVERRRWHVVAP